jgi:hypothetical protein
MSEPWLRGPVEGVIAELQPVAHALLYAREQLERVLPSLTAAQLWQRPGNIAPIGYHVRHSMGSIDRVLTYMRGEGLSAEQFDALQAEQQDRPDLDGHALLQLAQQMIERALAAVHAARADQLNEARAVGRKKLPSDVRGLYFEMAVHTARHVGQIATTAKLVMRAS